MNPTTSYLFDTSVLVQVLRHDVTIAQRLSASGVGYTSAVVIGELRYGAKLAHNPQAMLGDTEALTQTIQALALDGVTADIYSDIKAELRLLGLMIPDNDIWIAATARQYGLTLIARDAHFERISALSFERW